VPALADLGLGALLGLTFNPVTAFGGAALAGALGAKRRWWWAAAVVLVAWTAGDGVRVAAAIATAVESANDVAAGGDLLAATVAPLALWGLVGLALGYALPAWAGAFAGARVTHGTGWLAGGAIAAAASAAFASLGGFLGG